MELNNIDVIKLIRQIREDHSQKLKGKNHREKLLFYREKAKAMDNYVALNLSETQNNPLAIKITKPKRCGIKENILSAR